MKGFKDMLFRAHLGDPKAIHDIVELYRGLIVKEAVIDEEFDEDLMQILFETLLRCIRQFTA